MNWLDITIIIVITILTFIGFRTGIIRAAAAAAGIVAGTILSGRFYLPLSSALVILIRDETWAKVASFILIYTLALVGAAVVGSIIRKAFSLLFLGWLDGVIGGILGFVVAAGILSVTISILGSFEGLGVGEAMKKSAVAPLIIKGMVVFVNLLPKEFHLKDLIPL